MLLKEGQGNLPEERMKMRKDPRPFEKYHHFKGHDYQIITLAKDASDGHMIVVYQGLYPPYQMFARDLDEFMSDVDRRKYPDAVQRERFALIRRDGEVASTAPSVNTDHSTVSPVVRDEQPETHSVSVSDRPVSDKTVSDKTASLKPADINHNEKPVITQVRPSSRPESSVQAFGTENNEQTIKSDDASQNGSGINPSLLRFLDADSVNDKLKVLYEIRQELTPEILTPMELSIGMEPSDASVEERAAFIKKTLLTRQQFEKDRLR